MEDTESQLALLQLFGFVTEEHCAQALSDPRRGAVAADAGPGDWLIWMVECGIVDDIGVLAAAALPMTDPEGVLDSLRATILAQALPVFETRRVRINTRLLDELLAQGLITESEWECGVQVAPRFALKSPGQMLAHLVDQEVIWPQRLEALHALATNEQSAEGGAARLRILEEARTTALALQEMRDAAPPASAWTPLRHGVAALLAVCVAFGGYHALR